jgi:hypothetical protein
MKVFERFFYNGSECRGWVKRKDLACCGAHPHGTHMRRRVLLVTCKCNTHEKKSSSCHMLIQYLRGGIFKPSSSVYITTHFCVSRRQIGELLEALKKSNPKQKKI